jgi:anti-anti-sigma factor
VVQVAGELDMQTAPQLDSRLLSQIDVRVRHVVVDLSKVTFLGAAGLESLVRAREAATCHHIKVHLAGVDHRAVTLPLDHPAAPCVLHSSLGRIGHCPCGRPGPANCFRRHQGIPVVSRAGAADGDDRRVRRPAIPSPTPPAASVDDGL